MLVAKSFLLSSLLWLPLVAADLAPTGTLRAVFLGSNPVQGRVDPQTKAVTGPVADLVKELAGRLHVPYALIPAADARHVIETLNAHTADIGFLAFDPSRAEEVDFSRPYAVMYNTYLVRADSSIHKAAEGGARWHGEGPDPGDLPEQSLEKRGSENSHHDAAARRVGNNDAQRRDRRFRRQSPAHGGSGSVASQGYECCRTISPAPSRRSWCGRRIIPAWTRSIASFTTCWLPIW